LPLVHYLRNVGNILRPPGQYLFGLLAWEIIGLALLVDLEKTRVARKRRLIFLFVFVLPFGLVPVVAPALITILTALAPILRL